MVEEVGESEGIVKGQAGLDPGKLFLCVKDFEPENT
jgi:hypothetical protein